MLVQRYLLSDSESYQSCRPCRDSRAVDERRGNARAGAYWAGWALILVGPSGLKDRAYGGVKFITKSKGNKRVRQAREGMVDVVARSICMCEQNASDQMHVEGTCN